MVLFVKGHSPWNKGKKHMTGSNHPMWKGGQKINSQGYTLIWSPTHPYKDNQGYVRQHRLVVEKSIGRYLLPSEVVHHKNHIKNDNRIENLQLLSKQDHDRISASERPLVGRKKKCKWCKKLFYVFPSHERVICCSRSCGSKYRWTKI